MKNNEKPDDVVIRSRRIPGAGGTEIHVDEAGDPSGQPVLFIHGISQSRLSWRRQLESGLGRDLRLVAMDLRGHGLSDRPNDGYGDSGVWADDVRGVIAALDLDEPILCGWSYGGVVISDYISRYGDEALGGVSFVAAVSCLGESVMPFLGPEFIATLPGLFSEDVPTSMAALQAFIRLTTSAEPAAEDWYLALGYNSVVPPQVRRAMLSRTVNHDDVLRRLTKPVFITQGLDDKVVLPGMSDHHAGLIPHAKASYYEGIGHSPFMEDTERFNAELLAFASSIA
jgi:pimeloyl-ACP methyl ester carboxylesterase